MLSCTTLLTLTLAATSCIDGDPWTGGALQLAKRYIDKQKQAVFDFFICADGARSHGIAST